jgi:hypothetical protein
LNALIWITQHRALGRTQERLFAIKQSLAAAARQRRQGNVWERRPDPARLLLIGGTWVKIDIAP